MERRTRAELHEKAFRRLGCSPRVVVLDNPSKGVLSPDFYDPGLNPLYRDALMPWRLPSLASGNEIRTVRPKVFWTMG